MKYDETAQKHAKGPKSKGLHASSILAAILVCGPTIVAAQSQPATAERIYAPANATVPAAVQPIIIDIIARMNQAIDANDYETYAAFYAEDGAIDSGFGPLTQGRAAIVASLQQSAPFITNKRHVASNIVLNGTASQVTAVYYLTVFERVSGLTIAGTAVITDTFVRRSGRWQVTRHVTRMDPATLQAMSAAMGQ
jgi:ketosteroid isomerase-like protein